jgi:hypothetical protein
MYTTSHALSELDKFPAFRAELVELLELGSQLANAQSSRSLSRKAIRRLMLISRAIELRNALETNPL